MNKYIVRRAIVSAEPTKALSQEDVNKAREKLAALTNKTVVAAVPDVPKPKLRRKRVAHRIFVYRGITFFLVAKDENAQVCILDTDTQVPRVILEVPRAASMQAARVIAKIESLERELQGLSDPHKLTHNHKHP